MIGLALCLLASVTAIGVMTGSVAAQTFTATINDYSWLNTDYMGYDAFHGQDVIAYKAESSAPLVVSVTAPTHYNDGIERIDVELELSWETQKRLLSGPRTLAAGETAIYRLDNLTIPSITTASNFILHRFWITMKYDVKDGPAGQQATPKGATKLAVYTEEQAAYQDLRIRWNAMSNYYFWGFEGRKAQGEATYEHNVAVNAYQRGDFSEAATHMDSAVAKLQDAIEKDAKAGITMEEALTLEGTGGIKGLGFLIGGIGILFFGLLVGLGVLAWGFLKR